jgi:flagellin-like protein
MTQKQFRTDDSAVSPVIGVILMVAITVILAAVIGTFVLGLGESLGNSAPQAQYNFEYADAGGTDNKWVNVSHQGGDPVKNSTIDIEVGSNDIYDGDANSFTPFPNSKITAGDQVTINVSATQGDTVQIVWTSEDGQKSAVIAESEVA